MCWSGYPRLVEQRKRGITLHINEVLRKGVRAVSVQVGNQTEVITPEQAIDHASVLLSYAQDMLPEGAVTHVVDDEK